LSAGRAFLLPYFLEKNCSPLEAVLMAPPVSSALRKIFASVAVALFCVATQATTFPLPKPTRPTTFPLQRPALSGEVLVWGKNSFNYYQTNLPPGLTNVVAVSAQEYFTVALRNDGTVVAWGDNGYGQTNVPPGLSDVVAVSAGTQHAAALKSDGTVVCWGLNNYGQATVPAGLTGVVAVAAGFTHTLALKSDGSISTWGYGDYAQIPVIYYPNRNLLLPITNVIAISASRNDSFVLLDDDRTVFWPAGISFEGTNRIAQASTSDKIGVAAIAPSQTILRRDGLLSPSDLVPLSIRPVAFATGGGFTLAILGDGTLATWGPNWSDVVSQTPPRVRGVIAVAAGLDHAVVVRMPTPPIPTTAVAAAEVVNGFIVGFNIFDGGEGYAVPPQVTISGGGGSGATATAQISKGSVTGFTVTNAGIGYTTTPTVEIEPPPFLPKLSIATSRVGVTLQVVPGKRYQLESSNDLPNFGPVGAPFVADKDTIFQEFAVSETGQFFRIVEVP
jgi:hypothetical protein